MEGTFLGKIKDVTLGFQDVHQFGPVFELEFDGGAQVTDNRHTVPADYKETFRRSPEEWSEAHFDAYRFLYTVMRDAKVTEFRQLVGRPIEVRIIGNALDSWRILKEVL